MPADDGLADALAAARSVIKAHLRQTRNVLQFLTELDRRLDDFADQRRIAQEAERNGHSRERAHA